MFENYNYISYEKIIVFHYELFEVKGEAEMSLSFFLHKSLVVCRECVIFEQH